MSDVKTSISGASSYQEIGEYWDVHDAGELIEQAEPVEADVALHVERRYYPLDRQLSQRISRIAQGRGISTETLLNLWVQERLENEAQQI